jgi:hypothetical protein
MEVNMSTGGNKFCDVCGGAIGLDDLAPVKVEEEGHFVQLHFHNRHETDCLAQKLMSLNEKFLSDSLEAAVQ